MNGLTFLRQIMAESPIPVVICSSHVGRGTRQALEAMALGAVDIILKPQTGISEFFEESRITITDVIRAAACTTVRAHEPLARQSRLWEAPRYVGSGPSKAGPTADPREALVAIGASTGGPSALAQVFGDLPDDSPPMLIVQHMPRAFTRAFAQQLDRISSIEVREAVDGDQLRRSMALLAPGGEHMTLQRTRNGYSVRVFDGPLVSRHRPSVDVLFSSVAKNANECSIGVILTGMGDDGVQGMLEMRAAGMITIAQEKESCAVFGMPKEAIARSAATHVMSLEEIARAIASPAAPTAQWAPAFTAADRKARRELLRPKGKKSWKTIGPDA
jgi:two-component system chemotaxis response regulator CheB